MRASLVAAVVGCKAYSGLRLSKNYVPRVGQFCLPVNDYWGSLPAIKETILLRP